MQSSEMKCVFFYGLFMDPDLLNEKGYHPSDVKLACLEGYQLKIGKRASLAPFPGASAYGTIMAVSSEELRKLYGSDGVEDYIPERVRVNIIEGDTVEALTYLLPVEKMAGSNSKYAVKLANVAEKLNLPQHYLKEIEAWV